MRDVGSSDAPRPAPFPPALPEQLTYQLPALRNLGCSVRPRISPTALACGAGSSSREKHRAHSPGTFAGAEVGMHRGSEAAAS